MKSMEFTGGDVPARIRKEELEGALREISPDASVVVVDAVNWTRVDPETGEESVEEEPAKVVVSGIPGGVPKEQVRAVLSAHEPEEGDDEARKREGSLEERLLELEARVARLEGGKK